MEHRNEGEMGGWVCELVFECPMWAPSNGSCDGRVLRPRGTVRSPPCSCVRGRRAAVVVTDCRSDPSALLFCSATDWGPSDGPFPDQGTDMCRRVFTVRSVHAMQKGGHRPFFAQG